MSRLVSVCLKSFIAFHKNFILSGGKTTVSKLLQASFPWAKIIHQDAYFHPNDAKFHVYIPELNYYNWELETALNFAKMERDLKHAMEGNRDFVATGY